MSIVSDLRSCWLPRSFDGFHTPAADRIRPATCSHMEVNTSTAQLPRLLTHTAILRRAMIQRGILLPPFQILLLVAERTFLRTIGETITSSKRQKNIMMRIKSRRQSIPLPRMPGMVEASRSISPTTGTTMTTAATDQLPAPFVAARAITSAKSAESTTQEKRGS